MTLTYLQQLWLNSRGGRTFDDVVVINRKLYVKMSLHGKVINIPIPSDIEINKEYNVRPSIRPRYYVGYSPLVLKAKSNRK